MVESWRYCPIYPWRRRVMANMEHVAKCLLVMAVIFLAAVGGGGGGGHAEATPTHICNVTIAELAECLPAITGKSPPEPSDDCCKALRKSDLHCLCKHKSQLSNPSKAMELPGKCGLELPHECQVRV